MQLGTGVLGTEALIHSQLNSHLVPPIYLMLSCAEPRRRKKLAMLLEDLPVFAAFLASPTCMRTTVDVVKALRTFFSGLASMMYT